MKVKICGLTCLEDALCAVAAGADYLGFVLYEGSPRGVTVAEVARIREKLPRAVVVVGVMVHADREVALQRVAQCGLDVVQLHGRAAASGFAAFPVPVWRAVSVAGEGVRPDPSGWPASCYVVDAVVPGQFGGTGQQADWQAAAGLAARYPVLLAGGLCPGNVRQAIEAVQPYGVDVASGVELEPGVKSHAAIEAFVAAAKGASA